MLLHVARYVAATVNLFLGGLATWVLIQIACYGSDTRSWSDALFAVFFACFGAASLMAGAQLLRRRTAFAGARMQMAQANLGVLFACLLLAESAWRHINHELYPSDLYIAYWIAGLSGLWLALALGIRAVLQAQAKHASSMPQWETPQVTPTIAPVTTPVAAVHVEGHPAAPEAVPLVLRRW